MTLEMITKLNKLNHICEDIDHEIYNADDTESMRDYIQTLERALRRAKYGLELM